jgi:hypothetical protein
MTALTPQAAMMRAKRQAIDRRDARRLNDALRNYWNRRPCFICGVWRYCEHREYSIALAEAERAGVPAGVLRRVGA